MTSRTASRRAARSDSGGQLEPHLRRGERAFGPYDALGDGRRGSQERTGDLISAQAADELEGESGARIWRQDRVTGHEDQPEQIVSQIAVDDLVEVGLQRLRLRGGHQMVLAALGVAAADPVDGNEPRRRVQPRRRIVGYAVLPPLLDRRDEGVLGEFLGCVKVADLTHQPRDHAR